MGQKAAFCKKWRRVANDGPSGCQRDGKTSSKLRNWSSGANEVKKFKRFARWYSDAFRSLNILWCHKLFFTFWFCSINKYGYTGFRVYRNWVVKACNWLQSNSNLKDFWKCRSPIKKDLISRNSSSLTISTYIECFVFVNCPKIFVFLNGCTKYYFWLPTFYKTTQRLRVFIVFWTNILANYYFGNCLS